MHIKEIRHYVTNIMVSFPRFSYVLRRGTYLVCYLSIQYFLRYVRCNWFYLFFFVVR